MIARPIAVAAVALSSLVVSCGPARDSAGCETHKVVTSTTYKASGMTWVHDVEVDDGHVYYFADAPYSGIFTPESGTEVGVCDTVSAIDGSHHYALRNDSHAKPRNFDVARDPKIVDKPPGMK